MDKEAEKDMFQVLDALTFCDRTDKKCKKCKKKEECLRFIRSSIAVCLKMLMNGKNPKLGIYT